MADLKGQYQKIKDEINTALINCVEEAKFIKGPEVKTFEENLSGYLGVEQTITCGNGTDALQIALMALELKPEDEIIVPAFTYVATAEAIALLGLKPVMVDVDPGTFNISHEESEKAITAKTRAIVPVHLFGQSANLEPLLKLAEKHNLFIIEDNAQSLGADFTFSNGKTFKTGAIGHLNCQSFFPTKNLGCFGDGGAITTNNPELANKCRMISQHGQKTKYRHEIIGCNSRLDTLQAAVLNVKLKYLDKYIDARRDAAKYYNQKLSELNWLQLPEESQFARHTFNQFTVMVKNGDRDRLKQHLQDNGIPSIIYYPFPLHEQPAFEKFAPSKPKLINTGKLCNSVLSLPMHTELTVEIQDTIIQSIKAFKQ